MGEIEAWDQKKNKKNELKRKETKKKLNWKKQTNNMHVMVVYFYNHVLKSTV